VHLEQQQSTRAFKELLHCSDENISATWTNGSGLLLLPENIHILG